VLRMFNIGEGGIRLRADCLSTPMLNPQCQLYETLGPIEEFRLLGRQLSLLLFRLDH
jgi:hypothetical protein